MDLDVGPGLWTSLDRRERHDPVTQYVNTIFHVETNENGQENGPRRASERARDQFLIMSSREKYGVKRASEQ